MRFPQHYFLPSDFSECCPLSRMLAAAGGFFPLLNSLEQQCHLSCLLLVMQIQKAKSRMLMNSLAQSRSRQQESKNSKELTFMWAGTIKSWTCLCCWTEGFSPEKSYSIRELCHHQSTLSRTFYSNLNWSDFVIKDDTEIKQFLIKKDSLKFPLNHIPLKLYFWEIRRMVGMHITDKLFLVTKCWKMDSEW